MKKLIKIQNLHCAACAMELQEEIEKIKGVSQASVDFITQSISVEVDDEEVLRKVIKTANRFEQVKVINQEGLLPQKENRVKEIVQIAVAAILFIVGIVIEKAFAQMDFSFAISLGAYTVAYLAVGYPVLISTVKNLLKGKIFDENFLMTVASVGAFLLGECSEGVLVMLLYQLGELLQGIAVGSSRKSITNLMNLRSETATLVKDGEYLTVKPEELKIDDLILIKAGEKIPVDGVVMQGETSLDVKSLTGEGLPKPVKEGDEVLSGCINLGANIYVKVIREYENSAVAKILDMVEQSSSQKAAPEKFITAFAKYYTPAVCILSLGIAVFIPLIIGLHTGVYPWEEWIIRALSLLVISCPCALIISVPLTYFGGIGEAARNGVLVKGATYFDSLSKVTVAAFDKTGTLTEGNFKIVNVCGAEDTLPLAAAAERASSHPLAKSFAIISTPYTASEVREMAGKGIACKINGHSVLVGNAAFLSEAGVSFAPVESVSTVIYVAKNQEFLGYIEIDDQIKREADVALKQLKEVGIKSCVILTGDTALRAQSVAEKLCEIDEVYAGLLPDEKLEVLQKLKSSGGVLYVGDGINDAPVMSMADCAFSMGRIGSGAAIEASDFVLISDQLSAIARTVKIAQKTKRIVKQNIFFSIAAKFIFMCFGVLGILPLWLAVFGDVGIMLLAVLNALTMQLPVKN